MTLQTTTTEPETAEQVFAANGCDKNGYKLDAPKDEYLPGDEVRFRDHFGKQRDTLALDDDAREEAADDIVADDFEHALKLATADRDKYSANNRDNVRALASVFEINKLHELRKLAERKIVSRGA